MLLTNNSDKKSSKKFTLTYDLPTRVFHGLFASLFFSSILLAKNIEADTVLFSLHMFGGLAMTYLVVWRVYWGIWGSTYAKFRNFSLNPKNLFLYGADTLRARATVHEGHNPATSWVALAFFTVTLGLGVTGFLMTTQPNKEDYEDIHELLANAFIVFVIAHLLGIAWHTIRNKEWIARSMWNGRKIQPDGVRSIDSQYRIHALLLLMGLLIFGLYLYLSFDSSTGILRFFGKPMQLIEPYQ